MENSLLRPRVPATKPRKSKLKFVIAGMFIVGAIAFLGFQSFQSSSMFYLTVPELKAQAAKDGDAFYARQVRVSGALHQESIDWNLRTMELKFHLVDGADMFPVEFTGVAPDTFQHSETVVAEGRYTRAGVFQATNILVKCPSKYEPERKG
jgi:cytochrome c-type biogenesis protein CcmE